MLQRYFFIFLCQYLVQSSNGSLPSKESTLTTSVPESFTNVSTSYVPEISANVTEGTLSANNVSTTEKVLDESDVKLMAKVLTKALIDISDIAEQAKKQPDYDEFEDPVISANVAHVNDSIKVLRKWSHMTKDFLENIYKEALPYLIESDDNLNISSSCTTALFDILNGLMNQQGWAFRFFDAAGRISAGFIDGTLTDFGEYDECLEAGIPKAVATEKTETIVGKYCILRADFPLPKPTKFPEFHTPLADLTGTDLENTVWADLIQRFNALYTLKGFRFGICMPSTCSAKEAELALNKIIAPTLLLPMEVGPDSECDTRNDPIVLTKYQKLSITVYALIIMVVIIGTFLEPLENHYRKDLKENSKQLRMIVDVLLCFSAIRNTKRLFHVKEDRSSLSAVHGIRVLSILWIIVGHTYVFGAVYRTLYVFKRLQVDIPRYPGKIQYQALNNAYLLVDSFFFVSGLVLMYVSIPQMRRLKGKFNYVVYIVHRWLRLTPALVGLILFIYLFPLFGNGPIFKKLATAYSHSCEVNWWYDLLYISNWYSNIPGMCAEQVWFIGADFQMYIFAPMLFLTFYRNEKLGVILNVALIFFGIFCAAVAAFVTGISATFNLDHVINDDNLHYMLNVAYLPTYQHIAPYCIGTLCGFLILKFNENPGKWKMPSVLMWSLWIILPLGSMFAMFSTYRWNNHLERTQPSKLVTIMFAATQRALWSLGIAWVTFLCGIGKGGIINDILSWKKFVPLSRLSFSIFLVHLLPILLRSFSVKYTRNWDDHTFLSWALMNTLLSCIAAFFLYILFESPLSNVEKIILGKKREDRLHNGAELSDLKNNCLAGNKVGVKNGTQNGRQNGRHEKPELV